jgi:hypothetical protein
VHPCVRKTPYTLHPQETCGVFGTMMLGLKGTSPTVARVSLTEKKISVSLTEKKNYTADSSTRESDTRRRGFIRIQ